MSLSLGTEDHGTSEINVTPMIDILLVLLIIFMVIVPVTPKGLSALVPQPPKHKALNGPESTIVVQVLERTGAPPAYKINELDVTHAELLPKLTEIYANRAERVMFVKSEGNVDFATIADVIDIARAADVDHIGLMTPKVQASR